MADKPAGQRFSHVYRDRSQPVADAPKMRYRLSQALEGRGSRDYLISRRRWLSSVIQREIGIPAYLGSSEYFPRFMSEISYEDMLDLITVVYRALKTNAGSNPEAEIWRESVRRIFQEENIALTVDDECGVHFAVDEEFAVRKHAVLEGLGGTRYTAVNAFFTEAYSALDRHPPDTRHAVRATYEAIENLFKIMLGAKVSRLGKAEIDRHLKPLIAQAYQNHDYDAAKLMLSSLGEWVNGIQQYRHAPGHPDPAGPPIDLAVMIMSAGASYLRWLLQLDRDLDFSV